MAGSLNHIVQEDGTFTMDLIENMGDAHEALHDCFNVIVELSGGDAAIVNAACDKTNQPTLRASKLIPHEATW